MGRPLVSALGLLFFVLLTAASADAQAPRATAADIAAVTGRVEPVDLPTLPLTFNIILGG